MHSVWYRSCSDLRCDASNQAVRRLCGKSQLGVDATRSPNSGCNEHRNRSDSVRETRAEGEGEGEGGEGEGGGGGEGGEREEGGGEGIKGNRHSKPDGTRLALS